MPIVQFPHTLLAVFPARRDKSGTGEINNKHSEGESYFQFLLLQGLLQGFLLHYTVRFSEPENSFRLLVFNI